MDLQRDSREASPRAVEGGIPLAAPRRGRSTAPHLSIWLPIVVKGAAAAGIALILAVIGAKAGAHGHPPPLESAPVATAPMATANLLGLPVSLAPDDGGSPERQGTAPTAGLAATAAPPLEIGHADADPAAPGPREPTSGHPLGEVATSGDAVLPDGRVVLNLASEAELTKLPGIGPSRARAILALRQRLTKFRAVEDLLRIKGIGRKMLRRLRPSVVLDRPVVDLGGAPPAPGRHAPPAVAPDGT